MARDELEKAMAELGLTIDAQFVPWSRSRSAKKEPKFDDYNLNWRVRLMVKGREVLVTDYSAGMASCPGYKQMGRDTTDYRDVIMWECENGKAGRMTSWGKVQQAGYGASARYTTLILPDPINVMWGLIVSSDVLTAGGFESWVGGLGYDVDSRKAESIYRACVEIATKLVAAVGLDGMQKLQEAAQDY